MKHFLLLIFILPMVAFSQKVINDPLVEVRTVPAFKGIKASGGIDIYLSQSGETAVAVSAIESKYRDNIRTEVKDGILNVWYDEGTLGWLKGDKKLRAYISYNQIDLLDVSGACNVNLENKMSTQTLMMKVSGACTLKGEVDIKNLDLDLSGASTLKMTGAIENMKLESSGASDVKNYDLVVQNCVASLSGASDVKLTVENSITATASGASSLKYHGNPSKRQVASSGASSIVQRND